MQSAPVSYRPTPPLPPLAQTQQAAEAGPSNRAADASLPSRPPAAALRTSGSAPRQPLAAVPSPPTEPAAAAPASGYQRPPLALAYKSWGIGVSAAATLAGAVGLATSATVLATGKVPVSGRPVDLDSKSPGNQTVNMGLAAAGSALVMASGATVMWRLMREIARDHFDPPADHELIDLGAALAQGPGGPADEPAHPAPPA